MANGYEGTVTIEREAAVSAAQIWTVLGDLAILPEWAPGIEGAEITSDAKEGVGVVRKVLTAQFGAIEHVVTAWAEGEELTYTTKDSGPFSKTLTSYKITGSDDGHSKVTVDLSFDIKPGAIEMAQAEAVIGKGLTATLQSLEMRAKM